MKTKKGIRQILIWIIAVVISVTIAPLNFGTYATEKEAVETTASDEIVVDEGKILYFERLNPVYSLNAFKGSTFQELGLPEQLRVVMEISDDEKKAFIEAEPVAEADGDFAYYSYGYIAPMEEDVKEGELSIYSINYFDGSTGYRVYGTVDGEENSFFACDEEGELIGKVCTIDVSWDESQYETGLIGQEQRLVPLWSKDLEYDGEEIYASITETDSEESHCEEEEEVNSEEADISEETVAVKASQAAAYSTGSMVAATRAAAAETEYEKALTNIRYYTKTSGSKAGGGSYGTGVPGSWKDYVNTIFVNKCANSFTFADSGVSDEWKWDGTTASKTATATATSANTPNVIPKQETVSGESRWVVYSVQQFLYALTKGTGTIVIDIRKDLDFNGENYNWMDFNLGSNKGLRIEGNDHTFYNICGYTGPSMRTDYEGNNNLRMRGRFINTSSRSVTLSINDLVFDSAFCATYDMVGGGLFGYIGDYAEHRNYGSADNVIIKDSLFYNGGECMAAINGKTDYYNWGKHISPFGVLGSKGGLEMTACSVVGCSVYGADHVIGLITRAQNSDSQGTNTFNNCFVTDTKICGTGGHSSGFMSCQIQKHSNTVIGTRATDCFVNVDMYGSKEVAGFNLIVNNSEMTNCFVTGKIEGYMDISGFIYSGTGTKVTNCYSTALVGMRSESKTLAGFCRGLASGTYTNCYAAGEVGNHTTVMNPDKASTTAGGFSYGNSGTYQNCYYDKQTTAMREWVTSGRNLQKGQSLSGVKGVLTTDSMKSGNGLTGVPASGDSGFTGLSDSVWYYEEGLYPQLKNMKDATASDWGSQYQANLAKANSRVSVSTVYLDTWDEGYDWNSVGVRSKEEVSYARTREEAKRQAQKADSDNYYHLGNEYTYDTVRSIISDFTSSAGAGYEYSIGNGSGTLSAISNWKTDVETTDRGALSIGSGTAKWEVEHPGMEWINITQKSPEDAWRPLRLIAFMNVEAGEDQRLNVNDTYDHRADVELTIMDSLSNDLVIGFDDDKRWSTAATQGYPGYQEVVGSKAFGNLLGRNREVIGKLGKHYIEVPTAATDFSESEDAWVYTEIWMTEQNGVALDEPMSVKVTGEGTNGATLTATEKQWMGALPIGMGMHAGTTFEVSYYWMLEDGRYRTDSKIIELLPGEYDLEERVYNEDGSANSTALRLGSVTADDIKVDDKTSHSASLLDNERGTNVVAAWLNNDPSQNKVTSLSISFSQGGVVMGSAPSDSNADPVISDEIPVIYDPQAGDEITIRVPYYGYTTQEEKDVPGDGKYSRVVTQYDPLMVDYVYKVLTEELSDGSVIYYLVFDKEATWMSNNWSTDIAQQGISLPDSNATPFADMSIMQIEHDIEVIFTVAGEYGFSITKTDGATDIPLEGVTFNLYEADNDNVRTLEQVKALPVAQVNSSGAALTSAGVNTGENGIIDFKNLKMGKWYYLVETAPKVGYVDLDGMVRLHRDTDGRITMKLFDEEGNAVGEDAVYDPDPTASRPPGTVELTLDTWSSQQGGGTYVSTSIKNYQGVDLPESGGSGIEWIYLLGGTMILLGFMSLLLVLRKSRI